MNLVIGWSLGLMMFNYAVFALTGYPMVWCWLLLAAKPIGAYMTVANLALAAGIIGGGIWYGPLGAIKVAVVMVTFNLVPRVLEALMGFGYRCG